MLVYKMQISNNFKNHKLIKAILIVSIANYYYMFSKVKFYRKLLIV